MSLRDTITAGAAAGTAASLVVFAGEQGLSAAGLIEAQMFRYIERLVLPADHGLPPWLLTVIVFLNIFISSAFFGLVLAYIYRISGWDHWLLKAAGFGGILFLIHTSIIPKILESRLLPLFRVPAATMAWQLVSKFIWAFLTGYLLVRWLRKKQGRIPSR